MGLYSTFRAWNAMVFKSSLQSRLTVATMFLRGRERARQSSRSRGRGKDLAWKNTKEHARPVVGTRRAGTHCSCGTMPDGCTLKSTEPSVTGAGTTALDVPAASGWPGASSAPLIVPPLKSRQRGTNRAPSGDVSRLFRRKRRGSKRGG